MNWIATSSSANDPNARAAQLAIDNDITFYTWKPNTYSLFSSTKSQNFPWFQVATMLTVPVKGF